MLPMPADDGVVKADDADDGAADADAADDAGDIYAGRGRLGGYGA